MLQVVTIDGISGSGKSSTAKLLAKALGFFHLDSGAMYRMHTLTSMKQGFKPDQHSDLKQVADLLEFSFAENGELLANGQSLPKEIRSPEISSHVSEYCKAKIVREALAKQQRKLGVSQPCVAEGRDMGTVVFPDAQWKFYMTARPEVRAKRRAKELEAAGMQADYGEILQNLQERDSKDTTREHSPLRQADGAVEIDTSDLTLDEQVSILSRLVRTVP